MSAKRARRRSLRWFAAIGGAPVAMAFTAVACGGSTADATLFGDGAAATDASVGTSELDAASPPSEQPPPPASPNDAGVSDAAEAGMDAEPAPAPAGFVQCGATTCDVGARSCCGRPDGTRACVLVDAGFGACPVGDHVKCDSPSDCPGIENCRLIGSPTAFLTTCISGSVGFPRVYSNGGFEILACDPSPTPPYSSCPGAAPCIRQRCRGFVFDLCGEIPDGGCDP